MTDLEVLEETIVWLAGIMEITVIKDRQSVNRPPLPYATAEIANIRDVYQHPRDILFEELESENSEGLKEIKATAEVEVEWALLVNVYGDQPTRYLRKVAGAALLAQKNESLMPRLVVHEVGTINAIPEFIGQRWEPRAQTTLTLRGTSSDGFVVDTVEEHTINVTGERV